MRGEVRGLRCLITWDLQRPARGFAFPAFVVETVGGLDVIHFVRGVLTRGAMTLSAGRQAIAAARRAGEEAHRGWGGCGGWISSSFSAVLDLNRQLASQVGMSRMQMMYESGAQGRSLVIQTGEPSIENGAPSHKAGHHQRVQTEQSGEEHARGGGSPTDGRVHRRVHSHRACCWLYRMFKIRTSTRFALFQIGTAEAA